MLAVLIILSVLIIASVYGWALYKYTRIVPIPLVPPCHSYSDCPPGHVCRLGLCMPGGCTLPSDCPPGTVCNKGQCEKTAPCAPTPPPPLHTPLVVKNASLGASYCLGLFYSDVSGYSLKVYAWAPQHGTQAAPQVFRAIVGPVGNQLFFYLLTPKNQQLFLMRSNGAPTIKEVQGSPPADAAWLYDSGMLLDPTRTFVAAVAPDPSSAASPVELHPYDVTKCHERAYIWSFASPPAA